MGDINVFTGPMKCGKSKKIFDELHLHYQIVLADTGNLCIDEFDKLTPSAQKSLNEPMEQLSVSSAKAGLVQY